MEDVLDLTVAELGLTLPDYWSRLNAEPIKRIARRWLGTTGAKSGKQQNLDALAKVLENPARMDAIRNGLTPHQHAALGLLARRGGVIPLEEFGPALLAFGHPYAEERGRYPFGDYSYHDNQRFAALAGLEDEGFIAGAYVPRPETDPTSTYLDHRDVLLATYSDARLLRGVEPLPPLPLPLQPLPKQSGGMLRRPAEVSLRLLGLVEALRRQSPFKLTNRGRPPKPLITKLAKTLGWDKALESDPHTPLPEAAHFFYRFLVGLQLMTRDADSGYVATEAEDLLNLPYPLQARLWGIAYTTFTGWLEYTPQGTWMSAEDLFAFSRFNGMRSALAVALGALPDPEGWYDFGQFEQALFDRVGSKLSLTYVAPIYHHYGTTAQQQEAAKLKWQKGVRDSWAASAAPFIQHSLAGPLYHLGLVELGYASGTSSGLPDRFRLTALGKSAFYDALRPGALFDLSALEPTTVAGEPVWIVQPNFDVIAYLDRMTPATIGFLGKVAERKPSDGGVAIYRLTRETVYAGLENGLSLPVVIEELERGAGQPLPATIRRALEDWSAKRERLTLYTQAELLEYADTVLRDAALARQPQLGLPLGERFILVSQTPPPRALSGATVIDYLQPPVRCLEVAEDGRIELDPSAADFLIRGELAQWVTPAPSDPNDWRLCGESVGRAAQGGWTAEQILAGLEARSRKPIPSLAQVAVRAWARKRQGRAVTGMEKTLVLQFADETAAGAVASSALFQPLLGARLGPRTFLVDAKQQKALTALLDQFGLAPGTDLAALGEK
jgi:hypothetical protein